VSGEPKETGQADAVEAGETGPVEAEPADATEASEEASAEAGETAEETGEQTGEEPRDAPVFEVSDRRAKIVADHRGVRLSLDDQACEFRWDEIGALETETPRFGKRLTVTVHTPDRRWYPIEIEAKSRSSLQEWESRLDEVLDSYFEEGAAQAGDSVAGAERGAGEKDSAR
jgi:hypothetical protein